MTIARLRSLPVWGRNILIHGTLLIFAAFIAIPLYWTVLTALTTLDRVFGTFHWLPQVLRLQNFSDALSAAPFATYFFNSTFVAVVVTLTTVATSALAGYGFAKFPFPGRSVLFGIVLITLMVPFPAYMIPLFLLVKQLTWLDSFAGLIVPGAVSGLGIFLMRQFMTSLPDALFEAARIDGANEFVIFWRIVVPLSRSPMIALAVLTFLASWNNFLWPFIVVQSPQMLTVPLGLSQFQGQYVTNYPQIIAAAIVAAVPVVVLYLVMQRYIITSFAASGIKG